MNSETMSLANSGLVFVMAAIPIALVMGQALVFITRAWKEAKRLDIEVSTLKRVVTNSAVFSIVPSLPIIIILAVLMPALGKFIPWLRLSVLGSAMYENMAADMAVKTFGLSGIADSGLTPSIWISVVWVMTIGVVTYPFINAFFLKGMTSGLQKMQNKGGFGQVAIGSLFLAVMCVFLPPYFVDFKNTTQYIAIAASAIVVILLDKFADKIGVKALREFSFPIALVAGMAAAVIANLIGITKL